MISFSLSIILILSLVAVSSLDTDSIPAGYRCNRFHRYRMEVVLRDPLVLYLEGFITDQEAEALIDIAYVHSSKELDA